MDATLKMESHLQSAAVFVEGGIQDACDDSCSICLEAFCESDPSTVCDSILTYVFVALMALIWVFWLFLFVDLFSGDWLQA